MYPRMAMHNACAALQARIVAGTPTPPVETPATPPAAETHEVQTVLHPVRISLNPGIPSTPPWINEMRRIAGAKNLTIPIFLRTLHFCAEIAEICGRERNWMLSFTTLF